MFNVNYTYQNIGDTIQIHTTGCDIAVYDARKFANTLPKDEKAIVYYACSVFNEREVENKLILELLSSAYPEYKIYVLGCDVQNNKEEYSKFCNQYNIYQVLDAIPTIDTDDVVNIDDVIPIKVQDGCMWNCSYCIIGKLRNKPFSLPYSEIVKNLNLELQNKSSLNIEICGTEITAYHDKFTGYNITQLLENIIKDFPQINRLTIGSLDPGSSEIENIIDIISNHPSIMIPHIHLATQSGSDTMLKMMRRRHNISRVKEITDYAKSKNISVGWDIIVGFPGETEELFQETLQTIRELKPYSHTLYKYSARKGTEAYNMSNHISEELKEERYNIVRNLLDTMEREEVIAKSFEIYSDSLGDAREKSSQEMNLTYRELLQTYNNIFLDMFNLKDMVNFIRQEEDNSIVHVKFNNDKPFESAVYINFIKTYKRGQSLFVHFQDNNEKYINDLKINYPHKYFSDKKILYII